MAVRIRLKRTGTRNASCFRVEVMDQRSSRDGRSIETIGFYDPRHKEERIDLERVEYWVSNGAQPSETVEQIIRRVRDGVALSSITKPATISKKAKAKIEAEKKAAADAAAKAAAEAAAAKAAEEAAAAKAAEEAKAAAEAAATEEAAPAEEAEEAKAE